MVVQFSEKRKFVTDGIFKLAEDGYSGVENVLGEKGWQIWELTAVVQKRFGFPEGRVELYAEKVTTRDLCGVLGIKMKILLPWEPGKISSSKPLSNHMSIVEPKDEILPTTLISEQKGRKLEPPAMPQPVTIA
uniref:Uncharacterized protein n=1 Tax=Saimiri boliviensis boliviensis TaxID=39432 RepID=A0A2K6UTA4_SAIBB